MAGILDRIFGRDRKSAHLAKERLKLVLVHDRTDISPGVMELMKDDLIAAISKHIDIDAGDVRIEMATEGHEQRLIADIALRPPRRR
ncbi:MAG: cell division topological specificity factor MinE [Anaerolineales bacterium]|nr:cell division topological specificity factor MinE [Anaerolineales bacterium]